MSGNTIGRLFSVTSYGESHGKVEEEERRSLQLEESDRRAIQRITKHHGISFYTRNLYQSTDWIAC